MHQDLHDGEGASTSTAVLRSAITLAMTSQNGMAVRMMDRMKPVMYPRQRAVRAVVVVVVMPAVAVGCVGVCCALVTAPHQAHKVKTPIQTTSRKCQNTTGT